MERDNAALRAVFHDARSAKEQLMTEMASLEEEHAKVETEREAFMAREGQLVAFITSRGMAPPPVFQLPPTYATVLSHYLDAAAAGGAPAPQPASIATVAALSSAAASAASARRGSDASGSGSILAMLSDDAVSVSGTSVAGGGGGGGGGGLRKARGRDSSRLGPVRAAPPPPPSTLPALPPPADMTAAQQLAAIRADAVALRDRLVSGRA